MEKTLKLRSALDLDSRHLSSRFSFPGLILLTCASACIFPLRVSLSHPVTLSALILSNSTPTSLLCAGFPLPPFEGRNTPTAIERHFPLANFPMQISIFFHANLLYYVLYFQLLEDCWELDGTFFEQLGTGYIWKGSRERNLISPMDKERIVEGQAFVRLGQALSYSVPTFKGPFTPPLHWKPWR